ncbi:HAD-superfamily subfamily IB hydrolase, TIGR01490 [Virgibacillus subterraneus]|uniref:HAD-superfamily subfamily IB hydrolase, TIGR01490 n=1 Tax=Virgibacillus subterraneus TaxID=621109 RepID=A0A1H9B764_9BACI|nr:HAD family hydrolase [Virgibacillus subterraneus]SEP84852.1 HAD-superfamily subfamily IB hydrolase, TIGR01490 [Virgibacillus subterraneus]
MAVVTVDFDGTLFQGNSFKVMFQAAQKDFNIKQWAVVGAGVIKAAVNGILKGKNAFRISFFKAFAKSFKGKSETEMDEFFRKLVDIGREDIHQGLVKKIQEHQEQGDEIIVLSGALHPFLKAFTREVNLQVHIISTELQYDQNGICTGEIGIVINGDEKVNKVRKWINDENNITGSVEVWAYADSLSDFPLFQFANHPIVVNPDEAMKKLAEKYNWPIFKSA